MLFALHFGSSFYCSARIVNGVPPSSHFLCLIHVSVISMVSSGLKIHFMQIHVHNALVTKQGLCLLVKEPALWFSVFVLVYFGSQCSFLFGLLIIVFQSRLTICRDLELKRWFLSQLCAQMVPRPSLELWLTVAGVRWQWRKSKKYHLQLACANNSFIYLTVTLKRRKIFLGSFKTFSFSSDLKWNVSLITKNGQSFSFTSPECENAFKQHSLLTWCQGLD